MKTRGFVLFILLGISISGANAQIGSVKSVTKISLNQAGFPISSISSDFGKTCKSIGDFDKDGITDFAVSSWGLPNKDGGVFILLMKKDGTIKSYTEISEGNSGLPSNITYDMKHFGYAIDTIGDLDKDGIVDLVVGNPIIDGQYEGFIFVLFMNSNGTVKSYKVIGDHLNGLNENLSNTSFGMSLACIGDIDKDGNNDIVVGADHTDNYKGAIWILNLNSDGSVKKYLKHDKSNLLLQNYIASSIQNFGCSSTFLGDLGNEDTIKVLIGMSNKTHTYGAGSSLLISLLPNGNIVKVKEVRPGLGGFNDLDNNVLVFGFSSALIGDINGDNINDIAISSPAYSDQNCTQCGAIWVLCFDKNDSIIYYQRISNGSGNFTGYLAKGDFFASGLSGIGDFNGDGIVDIIASAKRDDDGGLDKGAVYILHLNGDPLPAVKPVAAFEYDTSVTPILAFTDKSTNIPTWWHWDFDDTGTDTSNLQNPQYTFKKAGSHHVCLTASNLAGSNTACKDIVITIPKPVASFTIDTSAMPLVKFSDKSTKNPTTWSWDFNDGAGSTSSQQNPQYTFKSTGTHHVCLTASNAGGSSTAFCNDISVFISGIEEEHINQMLVVYPNPFSEQAVIEIVTVGLKGKISMSCYNVLGEKMHIDYSVKQNTIELKKGKLANGSYFFEVYNDEVKIGKGRFVVN